jgi:hypothetical protein
MSEETKNVASETVSEQPTQETPASSPDDGALIAESKKYRKRAQDAEARIAEMEKKMAKAEEAKLKEKEDFKTLYEKVASENETLSSVADKWTKYEETRRASLLEKHPENEREQLERLDLDTLEFVTGKITNTKPNAPEVVGRSKDIVINKEWKDMTESERRDFYASKAKGN